MTKENILIDPIDCDQRTASQFLLMATARDKSGLSLNLRKVFSASRSPPANSTAPFSNGSLSPNSSQSQEYTSDSASDVSASSSGAQLVNRNTVVCSTGRDKYSYDSENANVPIRSIDYEPVSLPTAS